MIWLALALHPHRVLEGARRGLRRARHRRTGRAAHYDLIENMRAALRLARRSHLPRAAPIMLEGAATAEDFAQAARAAELRRRAAAHQGGDSDHWHPGGPRDWPF